LELRSDFLREEIDLQGKHEIVEPLIKRFLFGGEISSL
jgi:hypothetical protein